MSGAVGVIIFIVGLLVSIGLHELGHMYPAKKFGVRVSQYMIGFGPTLWSRVKGETEYGLKAIPLGGYVRIIGMFGPKKEAAESQSQANSAELNSAEQMAAEPNSSKPQSAEANSDSLSRDDIPEPQISGGLFKSLIAGARAASLAEIRPGEESRAFYLLSAPKKFVVMFGGPFMNLLLASILLTTAVVWVGSPTATTEVNRVVQCLSTAANPDGLLSNDGTCGEGDFSPAHKAGLKPGDKLLEIGGRQVSSWDKLGELLRGNEDQFVTITYQRSTDQLISKRVKIATREVPIYDASGNATDKTERVGYLGVTPKILMQGEAISTMPSYFWRELGTTFSAILSFPKAVLGMGQTLTSSEPRPADGPVSVVGISQISGDIASSQYATFKDKLGSFLMLFGSLNMFLFAFNLVPILPLDGGHLAGALYEGVRRRIARLRGRPDPGPVDTARMMPLAYVMGLLLIGLAILSILTDLIKPISF